MFKRYSVAVGVVAFSASLVMAPQSSTAMTGSRAVVDPLVAIDRARAAGLWVRQTKTWSASVVDFNRDGDQDVLVNYHGQAKLWSNRGSGRYRWVAEYAWPLTNASGQFIDRHNCDWADVDRNSRPDVYCSTGRTERNRVKTGADNELWLRDRRGRFREVGTAWRAGDVCGRGRSVVFLNANGDRYPDLFVGNQVPRRRTDDPDPCDHSRALPNEESKLFINVRGTRFRHAPRKWDYGAGPGTRCAEVLDFNSDGWDDLLACGRSRDTARLYKNRGGERFVDVTDRHGFDLPASDATPADLDGDRDLDIVTSGRTGFAYHLNTGGFFGPSTVIANVRARNEGRSVAVGDADGDGDNDVYGMVGQGLRFNPGDKIFINRNLDFTRTLPVPFVRGAADDVVALNPHGTGRTQFLVLNGRKRHSLGPIQLIRVLRR